MSSSVGQVRSTFNAASPDSVTVNSWSACCVGAIGPPVKVSDRTGSSDSTRYRRSIAIGRVDGFTCQV